MTRQLPREVDTVIVGSGPSSLILSYILHGNVPVYDLQSPHPDPILHAKLKDHEDLLTADYDHLTEHFYGSRFSYSTQALPVNVLLDTLVRPFGETDDAERRTCIKWVHDPKRIVPHVVVGNTNQAGGQWVDNPVKASWDIGTLSYAGMLSLPGYSFEAFYTEKHGQAPPFYLRPTRRDITEYFARYPAKARISDAIYHDIQLNDVSRRGDGFYIGSHDMKCKHLVLASGIFTKLLQPRPLLQPLLALSDSEPSEAPILVVGSGFSAADIIISTPPNRKIIHIFKWAPSTSPSPLRACHQQAYPEYAGVYRRMKLAAITSRLSKKQPSLQRTTSTTYVESMRNWDATYEGLPNTAIVGVEMQGDRATVTLQAGRNSVFTRTISKLEYVVGRRGSLTYLKDGLADEVCPDTEQRQCLMGSTLRERVSEDLEIAPNVFVIGSLTGDSLIRFAYGGCTFAARQITNDRLSLQNTLNGNITIQEDTRPREIHKPKTGSNQIPMMNGLQGHEAGLHIRRRALSD